MLKELKYEKSNGFSVSDILTKITVFKATIVILI